jgi:hypothetical protein
METTSGLKLRLQEANHLKTCRPATVLTYFPNRHIIYLLPAVLLRGIRGHPTEQNLDGWKIDMNSLMTLKLAQNLRSGTKSFSSPHGLVHTCICLDVFRSVRKQMRFMNGLCPFINGLVH